MRFEFDDDWLEKWSLASLESHATLDQLVDALALTARYDVAPHLATPAMVHATLRTSADDPRGRGELVRVTVGASEWGIFTVSCSCARYGAFCIHAVCVLADLAISPALRDAVRLSEPTDSLLDAIPALRARARNELERQRRVEAWVGQTHALPQLDPDVTLEVSVPPDASDHGNTTRRVASIELRLREPGQRRCLRPPDLHRFAAPPDILRALAFCDDEATGAAFRAHGRSASIALHLLWGRLVTTERPRGRITFHASPLTFAVTRNAHFLATSAVEAPDAGVSRPASSLRNASLHRTAEERDVLLGRWRSQDGTVDVPMPGTVLFPSPMPAVYVPSTRTFFRIAPHADIELALRIANEPVIDVGDDPAELYSALRRALGPRRRVLPAAEQFGLPADEMPAFQLRVQGAPLDVQLTLEAIYTHGAYALGDRGAADNRDDALELAAIQRLERCGFAIDPETGNFLPVADDPSVFWTETIDLLRTSGDPEWTVLVADSLRNFRVRSPLRSHVRISLLDGWLETSVRVESENVVADMAQLRAAIAAGRGWYQLDDGTIARIHASLAAVLEDATETLGPDATGKLPLHQLGRVAAWAESADEATLDSAVIALQGQLRALAVTTEPVMPSGLTAQLRPYQRAGLAWLQFLDELHAGGILADDMGLGKTVMALGVLAWRSERDGVMPSLVVCPTSVAGNWMRESARFTPGLKTLLHHGGERHQQLEDFRAYDLVITTYAILRRDIEMLESIDFRYAILDEAQNVKNSETATTHAAARLRAEQRVALTGTPVENRLAELRSLMDFCNPGMLGSRRRFENRFERAVMLDPQGPVASLLRAIVRPFILRRTKREVLDDLPPKAEIDLACVPGPTQRRLYDATALLMRESVRGAIQKDGVGRSSLAIFTALLRLRQMACDPRLVDASQPASASVKRKEFLDLVAELVSEGRRALVFSQFVSLLTLWRQDLDAREIPYAYLDGSTKNRDQVVAEFQNGTAPLFLISLRAGGTGLNLTAADTVIHCDPWWNPAVEDQATDRAHRIGQSRAVTVYRLVAEGTVEEKIMLLKARKREIAEAVISDDSGALRGLSAEDIDALLGTMVRSEELGDDESEPL